MLTKSSSALNNASLLAAAGIDARLLSQMHGSGSLASLTSTKRSTESPVQKPKEDTQTQQQRQAAAKLALRKQLEKTLLQVRHEMKKEKIEKSQHSIFRSPHPNLLHQKCILSRTRPTQSSST